MVVDGRSELGLEGDDAQLEDEVQGDAADLENCRNLQRVSRERPGIEVRADVEVNRLPDGKAVDNEVHGDAHSGNPAVGEHAPEVVVDSSRVLETEDEDEPDDDDGVKEENHLSLGHILGDDQDHAEAFWERADQVPQDVDETDRHAEDQGPANGGEQLVCQDPLLVGAEVFEPDDAEKKDGVERRRNNGEGQAGKLGRVVLEDAAEVSFRSGSRTVEERSLVGHSSQSSKTVRSLFSVTEKLLVTLVA